MGLLLDGIWQEDSKKPTSKSGEFIRQDTKFHHWIGEPGFEAESGRYHLFVSLACPWAHRTLIFRKLKKLEDAISLSVVHWHMAENGWTFEDGPGVIPDPIIKADFMNQVYTAAKPDYTGRASVPVLWDRETGTIVSNESSEIIRMFNSAFDAFGDASLDFHPRDLHAEIDAVNERIYHTVNNGVYKSGFATTQDAYGGAVRELFGTLDWLEDRLARQRYLAGGRMTEADWRLFPTLVRFDPVYHGHFKCNIRRLIDYPNLWNYTKELYQVPGVAETVDMHHIKTHYYGSHETVNPTGIVPKGPTIDFAEPHGREALKAA